MELVTIAIFPGSFDPFTNGHLDLVRRASQTFNRVIVAVLNNPDKQPLFTVSERMELISAAVEPLHGVEVDSFMGLLVDYVKLKQATVIVRGIRNGSDLDAELPMAQMNEHMHPEAVTLFLGTRPEFAHFSSSLVKQVAKNGGPVTGMVPSVIEVALHRKMNKSD